MQVDWREGDPGGRLLLDMSDDKTSLLVSKRCVKTVRSAESAIEPAAGSAGGASSSTAVAGARRAATSYRLTVCAAFERSWQQVIEQHGTDWCGFSAIRAAYRDLHQHGQQHKADACGPPRVISVELWDTSKSEELVSAEIGVIIGRCYVCLSLVSRTQEYPRSDAVRLSACVLWLRRAGVELFDAGTTADYMGQYGYQRCASRRAFTELWRAKRGLPLSNPGTLRDPCDDVRGLLKAYQQQRVGNMASPHQAAREPKHTVRISGLRSVVAEEQLLAALAQAKPELKPDAIQRLTIVGHLGAAFVTVTQSAYADVLLALDGCVLPFAEASIVRVQPHGRKVKRD